MPTSPAAPSIACTAAVAMAPAAPPRDVDVVCALLLLVSLMPAADSNRVSDRDPTHTVVPLSSIIEKPANPSGSPSAPAEDPADASSRTWYSVKVTGVPPQLTRFAAAQYKIGILRNRLFIVQTQIAKRAQELEAAENAINDAFENMNERFDTYSDMFDDHRLASTTERDTPSLIAVGKQVAEAQDRHFGLTAAWLDTSPALANEILILEKQKTRLEEAIGEIETDLAFRTEQRLVLQEANIN